MNPLRPPLRPLVRPVDLRVVEGAWARIAARRARPSRTRQVGFVAAFAALIIAAVSIWHFGRRPVVGPLELSSGGTPSVLASDEASKEARFSDGSIVTLAAHSELRVLESSATTFTTLLASGGATFDVVPGGPRRWRVEAGYAVVEVVGTRFSVERSASSVTVAVERGSVLVRADTIANRVERLDAGGRLVIGAPTAAPTHDEPPPGVSNHVPAAPSASIDAPVQPAEDWRARSRRRDFAGAYAILGSGGVARESTHASVDDLFALADVARLSGHPGEAVAPLRRIVDGGSDGRAAIAAFTLGKIELDTLGRPAAAAADFERALADGLPAAMVEDAHALRIQAVARSGRRDEARTLCHDFVAQFPRSSRIEEVRRWADERP